ncbi:MAG: sulfatase-like hydrolase/transferase [Thermoleophilaceae bacterium]|nr:sulfatase-like hydrolase/transferase [Thermoleophilaceae bacterium]
MRARALLLVALAVALPTAAAGVASSQSEGEVEKPSVVVLIFDEFPTDMLLGPDGRIDAERFPGFAELAGLSTWFPNASTIYDSTFKAVPSILDARLPKRGTAPDVRSHHGNVYTLFDRLDYGVVAAESGTAICPQDVCPGAPTRRPGVLAQLAGGGRADRLRAWIESIGKTPEPTLHVHHALLPHEPWIYLPSGHQSRPKGKDPIGGINRPIGFHDPVLTRHNEGRLMLQVGFVDRQIGFLLDHLREKGMLESSILAVLADHGYAFEVGVKDRRLVTRSNAAQIAPVPFFFKRPGQTGGEVDKAFVRNMDLVPTLADLLGVRPGWRYDGVSAFSDETRRRRGLSILTRDFKETITVGAARLARERQAQRLRRARIFETGVESDLLFGSPWAAIYRVGTHPELVGRRVADANVGPPGALRAEVANAGLPQRVRPRAFLLPVRVTGRIEGGPSRVLRQVAVAVNGTIRATNRTFRLKRKPSEFFSFLVPDEALRAGRNRIEVFEVSRGARLTPLYRSP